MIILGLNVYHGDSSASLLKDGEITIKIFNELFGKEHITYDFWFNDNDFKSPHCKKGFIKYWMNYNE